VWHCTRVDCSRAPPAVAHNSFHLAAVAGRRVPGRTRELGGEVRYEGDFIGHYITEFLYPAGLTRSLQIWLGSLALLSNFLIYGYFLVRKLHGRATRSG
jgi:hypothetical protein